MSDQQTLDSTDRKAELLADIPPPLTSEDGGEFDAIEELQSPDEKLSVERIVSILESLLFASSKPLSIAEMREAFGQEVVNDEQIREGLEKLSRMKEQEVSGMTLVEVGSGFQLRTRHENQFYVYRLLKRKVMRLSPAAMEVLAIVAYEQPVIKARVDEIRGVESGHLLRALMEKGLVQFGEKSDLPGKPMTYVTTRKFLEVFGLKSVKELPTLQQMQELLPEGIGEEEMQRELDSLSHITEQYSEKVSKTYSQGEDELESIQLTLNSIQVKPWEAEKL